MNNIYLPIDSVNDFACYSVLDKDTIRAYRTQPQIDSSSEYVDFYINSHYLQKIGTQTWGQWTIYYNSWYYHKLNISRQNDEIYIDIIYV